MHIISHWRIEGNVRRAQYSKRGEELRIVNRGQSIFSPAVWINQSPPFLNYTNKFMCGRVEPRTDKKTNNSVHPSLVEKCVMS